MSTHTPGPWYVDGKRVREAGRNDDFPKGRTMAQVDKGPLSDQEYRGNLALIATAPELWSACRLALTVLKSSASDSDRAATVQYLERIIAKAEDS